MNTIKKRTVKTVSKETPRVKPLGMKLIEGTDNFYETYRSTPLESKLILARLYPSDNVVTKVGKDGSTFDSTCYEMHVEDVIRYNDTVSELRQWISKKKSDF